MHQAFSVAAVATQAAVKYGGRARVSTNARLINTTALPLFSGVMQGERTGSLLLAAQLFCSS